MAVVNASLKLRHCMRCGGKIPSYSPMRKWCVECRHSISLEQAKARKLAVRRILAR